MTRWPSLLYRHVGVNFFEPTYYFSLPKDVALATLFVRHVARASEAFHMLWYSEPAQTDFLDALPIGNGFLGAMIHGYTDRELIRLNEESIWSGGPMDKIPPNAKAALGGLRQQILTGQLTEAGENWMTNFKPTHDDMRRYQPAGELRIDFAHLFGDVSDYKRSINLVNAVSSLSYIHNGTTYAREAFGSFPGDSLAFKLSASGMSALSFNISLSRDRNVTSLSANATSATISLQGTGEEDGTYRFISKARLVLTEEIQGANEARVIYTVETAFKYSNATAEQLNVAVDGRLANALEAGYESLRAKTGLELGESGSIGQQNVTERLADWKSSNTTNISDPELMTLQFNYGKYLLIQSSRPGTLPANLQGMNYWLAQPLDLREIAEPVVDFLDRLPRRRPRHAIEHFRFTGDEAFARERTLPILRGVVDFIYSWATKRDSYWITNPSCSPENSYIIPDNMSVAGDTTGLDAGAMNDRVIMWEIMTGFLQISEALNLTEGVERAAAFRKNIRGPVNGSYGQLLEYSREYGENDPGHRHFSPLVGVQRGSWISPLTTPEYADAAYTLLRHRMDNGSGGTSWSVVWASLLHSRLFDAPHALEYSMLLISKWVHNNLFSRNGGYFQIDGNLGFTASIVEIPAIPPSGMGLCSGSFTGWVARGGFKVDLVWQGGAVVEAEIKSLLGNPLKLRGGNGTDFRVDGGRLQSGNETIATAIGQKISISL
ncbi:Six-hairpin glycosidase-like protein [Xylariaceae sp. FL1651]|nr:Six-hairpin glycosidase-like protein [Xylariaceae sp. FL1651]